MQQSLLGLHSLETLLLSCEHLEAFLPELHLKPLPKLRHVRLDDVFPWELSLPPGCRLDLKGEVSVMEEVQSLTAPDLLPQRNLMQQLFMSSLHHRLSDDLLVPKYKSPEARSPGHSCRMLSCCTGAQQHEARTHVLHRACRSCLEPELVQMYRWPKLSWCRGCR